MPAEMAGRSGEEWRVFYDDTSPVPISPPPQCHGGGPDGVVFAADNGGGNQRILRLEDKNGDGDALDEGEWQVVYDKTAHSAGRRPLSASRALAVLPGGSSGRRLPVRADLPVERIE